MAKLLTITGVVLGAAVWFSLFVIFGTGLDTAFIAGGSVLAAGVLAAEMVVLPLRGLDAPLTTPGLLLGIAAFVILSVVLPSIPMWIAVVSGLAVIGLYSIADAAIRPGHGAQPEADAVQASRSRPVPDLSYANGHQNNARDLVGAR